MFSEAFDTFDKVLDIDATNQIAQSEIAELRKKLPMRSACRMKIEEVDNDEEEQVRKIVTKSEKLDLPDTSHVPKLVQNIVVEDPTPFDNLTKENKPREKLVMPSDLRQKKNLPLIQEIH